MFGSFTKLPINFISLVRDFPSFGKCDKSSPFSSKLDKNDLKILLRTSITF